MCLLCQLPLLHNVQAANVKRLFKLVEPYIRDSGRVICCEATTYRSMRIKKAKSGDKSGMKNLVGAYNFL